MNILENIEWLAQCNSGTCRPKREEEIDKSLPYFEISGSNKRYQIKGYNYEKHDNAPRMDYVIYWLQKTVLPNVDEGDYSGFYNIQLHDNYSYLCDGKNYKDVLCFGKLKSDKGPVQLPDCYFMGDWGGKYKNFKDTRVFEQKASKIVFAGTTTGSRDPLKNERIDVCLWAYSQSKLRDICDFHITNIAQIEPQRIFREVPDFKFIYRQPVPMEKQMEYKYQLVIDGNTCRWYPDSYFTNSLSFNWSSHDMLWYYPLLCDGTHYVGVNKETLMNKFQYYEANPQEAKLIIKNANKLVREVLTPQMCTFYAKRLFENIASNKA